MYRKHGSIPKCNNIQVIRSLKKISTICIMTFSVSCHVFSTLKIFSILRGFGNDKFPLVIHLLHTKEFFFSCFPSTYLCIVSSILRIKPGRSIIIFVTVINYIWS